MTKLDFNRIYAEYREKVWRFISRYVSSRPDREDLFQEVFLKIHRALPRFRGDSSLETWLYRIAANTSINHLKKEKRYRLLKEAFSVMRGREAVEPKEGEEDLKMLDKLNPQQRTILLLAEVEERKLEEIAEILKLPVGTVKSNLHRAKEILRKEIKGIKEIEGNE